MVHALFFPSLAHVQCPTLMLHAEDDRIVPIDLCRKVSCFFFFFFFLKNVTYLLPPFVCEVGMGKKNG